MLNRYNLKEDDLGKLSDRKLKRMIPMYIEGKPGDSHNCDSCTQFITSGACTIVQGKISGARGTCNYWTQFGKGPSTEGDIHKAQMPQATAGYVEYDRPINCSTCMFVDNGFCKLWEGDVDPGDCCMAWEKP